MLPSGRIKLLLVEKIAPAIKARSWVLVGKFRVSAFRAMVVSKLLRMRNYR